MLQDTDQLVTRNEAAAYLGLSPQTLANWLSNGAGPAVVRISSRCVRYRRSDLDAFVNERTSRAVA